MPEPISIEGPVELVRGHLCLRIPLEMGGDRLFDMAPPNTYLDGEYLVVIIPAWLAEKLNIAEGSLVIVDNANGKFTITRSAKNDERAH